MTTEEFEELFDFLHGEEWALIISKGKDYTQHDKDCLANFKRTAKAIDVPVKKVWAVFAHKHWDAIMSYIKTGKVESEEINGRLMDLRNYLALGYALFMEEKPEQHKVGCDFFPPGIERLGGSRCNCKPETDKKQAKVLAGFAGGIDAE